MATVLLPHDPLAALQALYEQELVYLRTHQIERYFPDTGLLRRELYRKHLEFFAAGATHMLRLFIAANRVGKSLAGCYEDVCHLTGNYPPWWHGRRFDHPVLMWVCGPTDEKIKETVQEVMLGPPNAQGTGLIPSELIDHVDSAAGSIKDLVDTIWVPHISGGLSRCTFKSYKQGREAFEGSKQDAIHNDEEVPEDIHDEEVLRLTDTKGGQDNGILYNTLTPLKGLTPAIKVYLPEGEFPQGEQKPPRYVVNATWDDVPHLSEETKALLKQGIKPFQLDARTRGIPVLGAGLIYPVEESRYLVDYFEIPKHWRRAYGLDVGWNRTACIWGAYDQEMDTWYLYHEYYVGEEQPVIHAAGIRAAGEWIPGVIDPAARGRTQDDGEQLFQKYTDLGLRLTAAVNAVETGLYECLERLSTGRLKVFSTLRNWQKEQRQYQRDEKGRVVKVDDHLMDAMRYLIMSGADVAKAVPVPDAPTGPRGRMLPRSAHGWMAR